MEAQENKRTTIHISSDETTSGEIARDLGIHRSTVSMCLSLHPNAPESVKSIGKVRVYRKEDINTFITSLGNNAINEIRKTGIRIRAKQKEEKERENNARKTITNTFQILGKRRETQSRKHH